jgi:hypothetical protein
MRELEIRQQLPGVRAGSCSALFFASTMTRSSKDEIRAESFLEYHAVVFEANGPLSLDAKAPPLEGASQDRLVDGSQQARPKVTVNTERGLHDRSSDGIELSPDALLRGIGGSA